MVIFAVLACAAAKPGLIGAPLHYHAAPVVAAHPPVITATSSQVVARTHNGIVSAPIIAPVPRVLAPAPVAKFVAPLQAAPLAAAYPAPVFAKYAAAASVVARYATAAYHTPVVAKYAAAAPLAYSAPLAYPHSHLAYAPSYASPYVW